MQRTRVIVVGAGPAGTVAAYKLARAGIDVLLLEANLDCQEDMRASTFHPPTLEMMERLGLIDALEAQGLRAPVFQYRNRRTAEIFEFDLGELSDVTRYPYRLQCEQFKLSRLVVGLLESHPHAEVKFGRRVLSVEQDGLGVTLHVEAPTEIESYRADYVIAADGASSTIRKWLKVGFDGFTYPEKFLTLSTAWPVEAHFDRLASVNYMADADEWCVLLRVPDFWRVLVPASENESDPALLSDAKKDEVFRGLLGDAGPVETHHRTIYRIHQRVAETFRQGRILLVGDAAHLNNPLGGLGMNAGIHDAWNLTGKLVEIIQCGADADPLLDRYDRQRRSVMHEFVQDQTIRNKKMLESRGAGGRRDVQEKFEFILGDQQRKRDYLLTQSMFKSLETEAAIA